MTNGYKDPKSQSAKTSIWVARWQPNCLTKRWLSEAYSIIEKKAETQTVVTELRDYLKVDHLVYYTSKLGGSPSADPYIRLTYPASWIARYVKMAYGDVDPVLREGYRRALPFEWRELAINGGADAAFMTDAAAHGVGPHGYTVPLVTKHGHRGLFAVCLSCSEEQWAELLSTTQAGLNSDRQQTASPGCH